MTTGGRGGAGGLGAASHLLVTNDFPPKTGGIQSYLWELWRRLPPEDFVVVTGNGGQGAAEFDAGEDYRVVRLPQTVLLPTPWLRRRVRALASETGARLVLLDPALPLGLLGPSFGLPYGLVLHGAEVTVPGRLPVSRALLAKVVAGASLVVSAGGYPEQEARRAAGGRMPPGVVCPPGVDVERFKPLSPDERRGARAKLGLPVDARLVVSVSRLVPRKGMDVLIKAASLLARSRPDVVVAIGGSGRDRPRLERLLRGTGAPVRLLGRVADEDLPLLDGCADVWTMLCRNRWGGLEQEGFGIVFVEAAACGVAQVAGRSGGADEAVVHGTTGLVVNRPTSPYAAAAAIGTLLDDPLLRDRLGKAARQRVLESLDYSVLAERLRASLDAAVRGM
jgi:phosphatidylinositol alpha-1,6-mannosyltransferase